MAKKDKAKEKEHHKESVEIIESPEALQDQISKSQEFAEKNKNAIAVLLTIIVVAIGGFFLYKLYLDNKEKEAQEQLFPAVFYFEKDSLNKALQGDGNYTEGLEAVSEEYGLTKAGNLANLYAGLAYLNQGEYDQAIDVLEQFSASDYLVQARAYALIGDAYMEKEDFGQAISYYKKAADYYPNEQFTPSYLLKLAVAYEASGDLQKAVDVYEDIVNEYKTATEVNEAKKYLAKAQASL
ncbi:tetratricopeptide repeat protein [Rapidithrix thailandica]|uniref:Tetratricopeptide repeat protein n=1 Tax=Rapidithrix thailandica TaxID=413964 RepID=A0AAW9RRQ9_9BACT